MRTLILDAISELEPAVATAAAILRGGGLVAFPTETVYGLGGLGLNADAVERIFFAKGRPSTDPLILHVASPNWVRDLTLGIPPVAVQLMEQFWPGPLTLVLPCSAVVPDGVTAGLDSVAVRMPAHPVALAVIRALDAPLAGPSANLFGHVSPTTAAHVMADLDGRIDAVLDAGPTEYGVESTVLDVRGTSPVILRPGGITMQQLAEAIGSPVLLRHDSADEAKPQVGPGLLTRHYSPRAEVRLYHGTNPASILRRMIADAQTLPPRAVVLALSEDLPVLAQHGIQAWDLGSRAHLASAARCLYDYLRKADQQGAPVILVSAVPDTGIGAAINDRLRRAASGRILRVH